MVGHEGGVKREANYSFINKILDFLRIKYSNLRSQTKEQDLLVLLKNSELSKYVVNIEISLSGKIEE